MRTTRSRTSLRARGAGAILLVMLALALLLTPRVAGRVYRETLGIDRTVHAPDWLGNLLERDGVAYPVHALLGAVLNRFGADPSVAALQWLKAGAHARSAEELERAARGISQAEQRSQGAADFKAGLCRQVPRRAADGRLAATAREAGLGCG